ncbi:peptidase aspartic [Cryomyces antarcticus]
MALPAPISIAPDQNWDGIDGLWNSFTLRIGTPEQFVRTFVSTSSQQTWVVLPEGCQSTTNPSSCADARGWDYKINQSSTWETIGLYSLWIERNLGYTGNAQYGYDTVGLGGVGEGGPTLKNMTVGGLAVNDFYLGIFGVNPKPTNFTSFAEGSPSYITTLRDQNLIPSVSFGYIAGARYRLRSVLASLTLGGYDASRFVSNNLTITFAPNNERDLVVAIQSITTDKSSSGSNTLLPSSAPIFAYIDSTVPQIWLPRSVCQAFEAAFGLIYDNATDLYLVNNTLHQSLVTRNASVKFTLGASLNGGQTVDITLPYAAFDLQASPPYRGLANSTAYFPLRRAANDTQYTLGRTFLQEAYLAVDWERANFNVSQCNWVDGVQQHLIAIPAFNSTTNGTGGALFPSSTSPSFGLTTGAIAGIVIGVIVVIAALVLLLVLHFRRTRRNAHAAAIAAGKGSIGESDSSDASNADKRTTPSSNPPIFPPRDLPAHRERQGRRLPTATVSPGFPAIDEAGSKRREIFEMPGDMPKMSEADSKQLTEKQMMVKREALYNGVDPHSLPTTPVENTAKREAVEPGQVVPAEPGSVYS